MQQGVSLHKRFFLLALLSLLTLPLAAQEVPLPLPVPLPGVSGYLDDVPQPEAVIGHQIGTRHTEPAQVAEYFRAVAASSDRVLLEGHGRTHEGRPLLHAFVSSPENLARLEAIRQANVQLSENPSSVSDADLADMPAVVLMGYSIHGNEASGTEAGTLLLYHLAAGQGQAVEEVLENTVVILDPMFNPDGRHRFTSWVNQNRGAVPVADPQDREHDEPWPAGRTNHYWFDLNRDWLPAVHPESQGRLEIFHHWRPQVLTDFHEMGGEATYFFQPGIPSRTNPNTPAVNQELTGEIAAYHAEALDRIGALYYTRESFDDFYYGKGSTFPDVNGAVGILFEQASSRALETETSRGTLTYAFTVRNQFTTSLSTLKAVVDKREELLRHMRDFYGEVPGFVRAQPVKAYVFSAAEDRTRAQALAELLQRHRIRLYELGRALDAGGRRFEAGEAFVVPLNQQQARLIKAVMETTTTFTDSLFYDVSAWTLPLAYGLDYAEVRQDPANLLGAEVTQPRAGEGELVGGRSSYAYLMRWGRYFAPRALYKLQAAGIRPRLMKEPFSAMVGGRTVAFPRGTVVIPVQQPDVDVAQVHDLVQRIVAEDHVQVYAVATGLTPTGPDLGSRGDAALERPRVAILTGAGTSAYNAGEAWHLLSERFQIPVSLLDVRDAARADLSRYNTLVMAGGSYGDLPADKINQWVRGGGRLIALTSAVDWVVEHELASLEEKEMDVDSLVQDVAYEDLEAAYGAQQIGGAIFEAAVDVTHPLLFGYEGATLPVFRRGTTFYEPSEKPGATPARYTDAPLLSGYLSDEQAAQAAGSAALVALRHGSGRVILMMDNPNFRGFWYGTNPLFLNAIFFGGAM